MSDNNNSDIRKMAEENAKSFRASAERKKRVAALRAAAARKKAAGRERDAAKNPNRTPQRPKTESVKQTPSPKSGSASAERKTRAASAPAQTNASAAARANASAERKTRAASAAARAIASAERKKRAASEAKRLNKRSPNSKNGSRKLSKNNIHKIYKNIEKKASKLVSKRDLKIFALLVTMAIIIVSSPNIVKAFHSYVGKLESAYQEGRRRRFAQAQGHQTRLALIKFVEELKRSAISLLGFVPSFLGSGANLAVEGVRATTAGVSLFRVGAISLKVTAETAGPLAVGIMVTLVMLAYFGLPVFKWLEKCITILIKGGEISVKSAANMFNFIMKNATERDNNAANQKIDELTNSVVGTSPRRPRGSRSRSSASV